MLELRSVSKSFFGNKALEDVTFTAKAGEIHALMGQNGAGKSTLMKILSGAYTLDTGQILIDGKEVSIKAPKDAEEHGISIVYQELSVLPHLTVAANITIGREPTTRWRMLDKGVARDIARASLGRLGVSIDPTARMGDLSVSQQQLCEIAKAISKQPKIVILDEPTSALTKAEREALLSVMKKMRDDGLCLIFITHHLEEVFEVADTCTVLRDGSVVYSGEISKLDEKSLVQMMVGHTIDDFYPKRTEKPTGNVALEIRGLAGGFVESTNLTLHYGEILGLSGLIGAGRTELARMIFGVDEPSSGQILRDGKEVTIKRPRDAIDHGIAYITEDRRIDGLTLGLSIRSNVSFVNIVTGNRTIVNKQFVNKRAEIDLARQLVNRVKIKCSSVDDRVVSLSGGNQQKTAIAKWVATGAKVYIFDEPTKGIDVASKVQVYEVINELADQGAAVIVISSYNPELIGLCDRIMVMGKGRITKEFTGEPTEQDLMLAQSI